ncbi:MAG TPA: enoyl-CoA hydratase/isomerase family protein [Novosphingobium sp.]|nr:enoyl-CoA hydratase/isomerase family protein [Novosphingobium sp.]
MSAAPTVLVERVGAVALVTLNRPTRRNGVTVAMCEALYSALSDIAGTDARVLVLRGAAQDFCVGADMGGHDEASLQSVGEAVQPSAMYHASTLLHTMPQVTIAAIDGGCAGAGMGWAMACDFRFASARARFSTAFLKVGVSGDMGLAWSLQRVVGGARARELLFFPERFGAEEAHRLGLVTRLFTPEALHGEALALAQTLAARDPLALRLMKANFVSAEALALGEYIEIETARHLQTTNRPELAGAMAVARADLKA